MDLDRLGEDEVEDELFVCVGAKLEAFVAHKEVFPRVFGVLGR